MPNKNLYQFYNFGDGTGQQCPPKSHLIDSENNWLTLTSPDEYLYFLTSLDSPSWLVGGVRLVAVRYVLVWEVPRCARPVSDSVAPVVAPGELETGTQACPPTLKLFKLNKNWRDLHALLLASFYISQTPFIDQNERKNCLLFKRVEI